MRVDSASQHEFFLSVTTIEILYVPKLDNFFNFEAKITFEIARDL